jgi:hypothetical protein
MKEALTTQQIWLARVIAVAADALQIVLSPALTWAVPVNVAIDVIVALILIKLVGWHIAFTPTFAVEVLPIAELAPTWTVAVMVATAGRGAHPVAEPVANGEPIRVNVNRVG